MGTLIVLLPLRLLPIAAWIRQISPNNSMQQIANFHTFFNVVTVAILLPMSRWLVAAVERMLPGKDPGSEPLRMMYVDENVFAAPPIAVAQIIREVDRMADLAVSNIHAAVDSFLLQDDSLVRQVYNREKVIDFLNHEITRTLVRINQLDITPEDKVMVGSLFHVVNDLERIGDHAENIVEYTEARMEDHIPFSDAAIAELRDMSGKAISLLERCVDIFRKQDQRRADAEVAPLEQEIDDLEKHLRNTHIERLNNGQCTAFSGMIFIELISNLERVADHSTNIAYSILDD
jgi:phosphate:Na+ symporter